MPVLCFNAANNANIVYAKQPVYVTATALSASPRLLVSGGLRYAFFCGVGVRRWGRMLGRPVLS